MILTTYRNCILLQGCVSVGETVLSLDNVSFMLFVAFTIDCTRSTAVVATNGNKDFIMHDYKSIIHKAIIITKPC